METRMNSIFGRINGADNVELFHADGTVITQLEACGIYPDDSEVSVRYEHPEGIVVSRADAKLLNVRMEESPPS